MMALSLLAVVVVVVVVVVRTDKIVTPEEVMGYSWKGVSITLVLPVLVVLGRRNMVRISSAKTIDKISRISYRAHPVVPSQ